MKGRGFLTPFPWLQGDGQSLSFPQVCFPKTASAVMAPSLQFWPWLALFCRETAFNKYQQEFSLGSFWEGVTGARALR